MSRALIRVAYLLLALLTLATFGGYVLIGQVFRGGAGPGWPPDRPVEWAVFAGVTGSVVRIDLVGVAPGGESARTEAVENDRDPAAASVELRPFAHA